jgi:pimeloyl-ACP methyl ester carboxylesterase
MTKTILFIHGAWVTPHCWDPFISYFEQQGYTCLAPTWPHKDKSVEELRRNPPAELAGLGVQEIVDHYAAIVKAQEEPPILIGHSFGGLFTQILLDRGLGAAGVAIDPAPPKGVLALQPTVLKSLSGVLFTWRGWRKIVRWSFEEFQYAFVHTLPEQEQRAAYETHVVPETGRIFFQDGFSLLAPSSPVKVDFQNSTRAPLLLIAGAEDQIVPHSVVKSTYQKYRSTPARTDFLTFEKRTHWIIAQGGWEEVATAIENWLKKLSSAVSSGAAVQ